MSAARAILAIARADFLERVRRYSFFVTLLFAVYLGYAAATGKVVLRLDNYRGVYTSGWIGLMVSLVTTTFVSLVGFYIVKNAVERDRSTGVGQILAATPLSKTSYMLGKLASNFAVLSAIVLVLTLGAIAMFFFAGEDPRFDLWAILSPFLLLALPAMALTAALALLFETIPLLRGGFGNVVWFFGWTMMLGFPEISGRRWLDPIGMISVMDQVLPAARAAIPNFKTSVSLSISDQTVLVAHNLRWEGIPWDAHSILLRLLWAGVAIFLALISTLVFDRFDASRSVRPCFGRSKRPPDTALHEVSSAVTIPPMRQGAAVHLTPLGRASAWRGAGRVAYLPDVGRIFVAELRLALQGYRWWWYAVAAGLLVAQFAAPLDASRGPLLAVAWLWPVLLWSAMGARESRFAMRQLLFSCAGILPRQLPACWLAGIGVALITGAGAAARLVLAGQPRGFVGILAAAIFIPSLALALGIWTGSGKVFEGCYTVLWYIGPMNHTPGLDFTGAASGPLTMRYAMIYFLLSVVCLLAALLGRARQLRHS